MGQLVTRIYQIKYIRCLIAMCRAIWLEIRLLCCEIQKIALVAIKLPNRTYTMACEQGSVDLGEGLMVKNVLFVPKLTCNLVSVSKLCKQLNCTVTF